MVYKIAVCDDDQNICRQLSAYIDQLGQETGAPMQVLYYSSGEELLRFMPEDVQILLLDISMGQTSGMQAARRLRARGCSELYILFITSMTEYAMEGYDVHAFAFLQKPVSYAALRRYMLDIFPRIKKVESPVFLLESGTARCAIHLNELLYAEVYQHDTCFHTDGGTIISKLALSTLEQQLTDKGFFRCHKSYLVNLRRIERIDSSLVTMAGGSTVPLSKYRRRELLDAWTRCVGVTL